MNIGLQLINKKAIINQMKYQGIEFIEDPFCPETECYLLPIETAAALAKKLGYEDLGNKILKDGEKSLGVIKNIKINNDFMIRGAEYRKSQTVVKVPEDHL